MVISAPDFEFWLSERLIAAVEDALRWLKHEDKVEGVHRARVALKRARALARLAREAHPKAARLFNADARAIMAALSWPRDCAAMADAARLAAAGARAGTRTILLRIACEMDAMARAGSGDVVSALPKTNRLLIRAKAMGPVSREDLLAGADALALQAQRAKDKALGKASAKRRHAWRKKDKVVQFAAKALGPLWTPPLRAKAAAALGLVLGAERDLLLLEDFLASPHGFATAKETRKARRTIRTARRVMGAQADRLGARAYRLA